MAKAFVDRVLRFGLRHGEARRGAANFDWPQADAVTVDGLAIDKKRQREVGPVRGIEAHVEPVDAGRGGGLHGRLIGIGHDFAGYPKQGGVIFKGDAVRAAALAGLLVKKMVKNGQVLAYCSFRSPVEGEGETLARLNATLRQVVAQEGEVIGEVGVDSLVHWGRFELTLTILDFRFWILDFGFELVVAAGPIGANDKVGEAAGGAREEAGGGKRLAGRGD